MDPETVAMISAAPATLIGGTLIQPIVDAIKNLGMPGKYAAGVAIILGAALGLLGGLPAVLEGANAAFMVSTGITGLGAGAMASRNFATAKAEGHEEGVVEGKKRS